jgi:hypothetical protein
MILAVRACIALSSITSRTRQIHRTPEPWGRGWFAAGEHLRVIPQGHRVGVKQVNGSSPCHSYRTCVRAGEARSGAALLVLRDLDRAVPGSRGPVHGADVRRLPGRLPGRPGRAPRPPHPGGAVAEVDLPDPGAAAIGSLGLGTWRGTRRPSIPAGSPPTSSSGSPRTSCSSRVTVHDDKGEGRRAQAGTAAAQDRSG